MSALGFGVGTLLLLLFLLVALKSLVGAAAMTAAWAGAVILGLLVGGFATYVGSAVLSEEASFWDALGTAALAGLAMFPVAWIPGVGTALAALVWFAVLYHRSPGEWFGAGVVGAVTWGVAFAVTAVFGVFGAHVNAIGVPGV